MDMTKNYYFFNRNCIGKATFAYTTFSTVGHTRER